MGDADGDRTLVVCGVVRGVGGEATYDRDLALLVDDLAKEQTEYDQ